MKFDFDFDDLCYLQVMLKNEINRSQRSKIDFIELEKYYIRDGVKEEYKYELESLDNHINRCNEIIYVIEKQLER